MKKPRAICLFVLFFVSVFMYADNDTWQKAVQLQQNSLGFTASRMISYFDLPNIGGGRDITVTESTIKKDSKGKITYDIVRATKNGIDITEESLKKAKNDDSKQNPFASSDLKESPFYSDEQKKIKYTELPTNEVINGLVCSVFAFTYASAKNTMTGKAWLEKESGRPLKIEYRMSPNPQFVEEMLITYFYDIDTANQKLYVTKMVFNATGSFMFMKFPVTGYIVFSEYKQLDSSVSSRF